MGLFGKLLSKTPRPTQQVAPLCSMVNSLFRSSGRCTDPTTCGPRRGHEQGLLAVGPSPVPLCPSPPNPPTATPSRYSSGVVSAATSAERTQSGTGLASAVGWLPTQARSWHSNGVAYSDDGQRIDVVMYHDPADFDSVIERCGAMVRTRDCALRHPRQRSCVRRGSHHPAQPRPHAPHLVLVLREPLHHRPREHDRMPTRLVVVVDGTPTEICTTEATPAVASPGAPGTGSATSPFHRRVEEFHGPFGYDRLGGTWCTLTIDPTER